MERGVIYPKDKGTLACLISQLSLGNPLIQSQRQSYYDLKKFKVFNLARLFNTSWWGLNFITSFYMYRRRLLLNYIRLFSILMLSLRFWRTSVMDWVKIWSVMAAVFGKLRYKNNCDLLHVKSLHAFRTSFWEVLEKWKLPISKWNPLGL